LDIALLVATATVFSYHIIYSDVNEDD
jgi:hypothetical protein